MSILHWQFMLRDYKPKPPSGQLSALLLLALRMDSRTGCGWTYNAQVAEDVGDLSEDTVSRATKWARDRFLLHMGQRGHRLGDGSTSATLWVLLRPVAAPGSGSGPSQTRTGAVLSTGSDPHEGGVEAGSNPHEGGVEAGSNPQEGGVEAGLNTANGGSQHRKRRVSTPHRCGTTVNPVKVNPVTDDPVAARAVSAQPPSASADTSPPSASADTSPPSASADTRPGSAQADAKPKRPQAGSQPEELFPGLPAKQPKPEQVAGQIADAVAAAVPLSSRPGTFQLMLRALRCGQYTHEQVRAAGEMFIARREPPTRQLLYYALEGRTLPPPGTPNSHANGSSSYQPFQQPPQDAYRRRPRAPR